MKPILEIIDIEKKFWINSGTQRYLSLRDRIMDLASFSGNKSAEFWALKGVSFNVEPGESIGIIGKNGAGKSTLLKVLSRITPPSAGKIICRGRIASLLEVGTGFHPELTGRENIYLNGSILGLKKREIELQFDAIVDFSGVEKFLDTPLKHYSSGMQLRLAFAVAAHLEPEILVIDEVLAVGDAEFQKKCMGKMSEVSKSGRTVLFVSHNMGVMQQLCSKIALLNQGTLLEFDASEKVIKTYLNNLSSAAFVAADYKKNGADSFISKVELCNSDHQVSAIFGHSEGFSMKVSVEVRNINRNQKIGIAVMDYTGRRVFTSETDLVARSGVVNYTVKPPKGLLTPGIYSILVAIHIPNQQMIDIVNDGVNFEIIDTGSSLSMYAGTDIGCVFADCEWIIN